MEISFFDDVVKKPLPPYTLSALCPPNYEHRYFENWKAHRFNPDATTFDLCNAWWLAEAALLAYADTAFVQKVFDEADLHETGAKIKPFHKQSIWCYVAYTEQTILVAFRGTELQSFWDSVQDLMTDFDFFLVSDGAGAKVHRGFRDAVESIWDELAAYLAELSAQRPRRLWLTGHSLGAALATIAADKLARCSPLVVHGLYTFGSPRVGDLRFLHRFLLHPFAQNTFRVVLGADVVTRVPPVRWFRHIGKLCFINERDELQTALPRYPSQKMHLRQQWRRLLRALTPLSLKKISEFSELQIVPDFLADHAPICYAIRVWNCYVQSLHQTRRTGAISTAYSV
ncbi:MAG: lipase family protein [Chloroherpetonaceae bacterium]|nr:lipase family protein [Chloroherpetonaceae bacterium]MCS7210534.1 lipase family protein [Chloroherpetonaceae bacterium]MDW8020983.1 lipase family protein [Chloroherpetonaceae bacterium]